MKTIQILWWKWQHAENLIDREIFKWCNIEQIEKWNTPINNLNTLFITPISKTKEIITNLTKKWWDSDFINLSWIMSTTPEKENKLIKEWNTPIETINDMVNFNDSSIIEINDFLGTLSTWTNIFKSYLDFVTNSLNEKQRYDFWTPSFSRVFNFCEENNFILDEESLGKIMKLDRDNFIDSIHTIR